MNYREVSLHGFENPDTQNVGVDNGGDIPEGFGSQLNLFYPRNGETVFAVPHRDGKQIGDVGYVIEGRPEAYEIAMWYRKDICGIVDPE